MMLGEWLELLEEGEVTAAQIKRILQDWELEVTAKDKTIAKLEADIEKLIEFKESSKRSLERAETYASILHTVTSILRTIAFESADLERISMSALKKFNDISSS